MAKLRVTWVRSDIGSSKDQKRTLKALGFHRLNESIVRDDSAVIRGMILKVRHLVKVEATNAAE